MPCDFRCAASVPAPDAAAISLDLNQDRVFGARLIQSRAHRDGLSVRFLTTVTGPLRRGKQRRHCTILSPLRKRTATSLFTSVTPRSVPSRPALRRTLIGLIHIDQAHLDFTTISGIDAAAGIADSAGGHRGPVAQDETVAFGFFYGYPGAHSFHYAGLQHHSSNA